MPNSSRAHSHFDSSAGTHRAPLHGKAAASPPPPARPSRNQSTAATCSSG